MRSKYGVMYEYKQGEFPPYGKWRGDDAYAALGKDGVLVAIVEANDEWDALNVWIEGSHGDTNNMRAMFVFRVTSGAVRAKHVLHERKHVGIKHSFEVQE